MSGHDDFSEIRHSIRQDNPENPFLKAATPEVLEGNRRRWIHNFQDVIERTRASAAILRNEPATGDIDVRRLEEAREVVAAIPLAHVINGLNMRSVVQDGSIQSVAQLENKGIRPRGGDNTYDFDREYGLHDFVFSRFSHEPFRIYGIDRATLLVFDHKLLSQHNVFASFEDIVDYRIREKWMSLGNTWEGYIAENFSGNDFSDVAAHYIAAAYGKPKLFKQGTLPDFLARPTGMEESSSDIFRVPPFEVKIYQRLPLECLREIHINAEGEQGLQTMRQLGLESLVHHVEWMVPW